LSGRSEWAEHQFTAVSPAGTPKPRSPCPAGKWKQYANDALGNLVTVLEPDPTANPVPGPPATPPAYPVTAAATGTLLTSCTCDQVNRLTQMAHAT
jgi:hypothetical protein